MASNDLCVTHYRKDALMAAIGRPREFDRDAALEAAMLMFWRKGFAATSMNDLCDAMGVRSPSLYAAFGSKEELYLEAIEHYVQTQGTRVWDGLAEGATARAGIENLLIAATESLPKSRAIPAGCVVRKCRLEMLGVLRSRLETAGAKGELPASTDIDSLSRFYLSVFQGMAIQAQDGATRAELRGVAAAAMAAWPGDG
jgi:AcrR family transcriptional regulator